MAAQTPGPQHRARAAASLLAFPWPAQGGVRLKDLGHLKAALATLCAGGGPRHAPGCGRADSWRLRAATGRRGGAAVQPSGNGGQMGLVAL